MKKLLLYLLFLPVLCHSNPDTLRIHAKGYNSIVIGETMISGIIAIYGTDYKLERKEYVWALANIGGGCLRLKKTKTFYDYPQLGLTFITGESDTLCCIIIKKPANAVSSEGFILQKTRTAELLAAGANDRFVMVRRNRFGFDNNYQKKAKKCIRYKNISYCFQPSVFGGTKKRRISQIRIGD